MSRRHLKDDSGAVAVIVAASLVLVMILAACAVDLGLWFTARRQLQSAADAAAMAGCNQLATGAGDAAIWAAVTDYAQRNFTVPVVPADTTVVSPSPGGLSDIGRDYVKVTVRTLSPSFFARVMGYAHGDVSAQSVAQIGYLAGGRGPVPWGLIVLRVGSMTADMGGQTVDMWDAGHGEWRGGFSAGHSGAVNLHARNSLGYVEDFPAVVRVGTLSPTGRIAAVDIGKTTFTSGVDTSCRVEVTLASPLATGGTVTATTFGSAVTLVLDATTGHYVGHVPIPTTSEPFINQTLSVTVKEGAATSASSCSVLVRRSSYIVRDVEARPAFAAPTDAVSLSVKTLSFDFGVEYELKVGGSGGTTGNFGALNFASIDHSTCGFPATPSGNGAGGSAYAGYIVGDPNLIVHIGDWVDTEPGNMVGPTGQGLRDRLLGVPIVTFDQWVAAGKPETKQLFMVPIVEKPAPVSGRRQLMIVAFATFFFEERTAGSQTAVVGRFVEYTQPGWIVANSPPGPLATQAIHLVSNHLDY
jgi:Flp pilus assembly protein TadG